MMWNREESDEDEPHSQMNEWIFSFAFELALNVEIIPSNKLVTSKQ